MTNQPDSPSRPEWMEATLEGESVGGGPALVAFRLVDVFSAENTSYGTYIRLRTGCNFKIQTKYADVLSALGAR